MAAGKKFFIQGLFYRIDCGGSIIFLKLTGEPLETIVWMFLIAVVSSFLLMNFTGMSTYTKMSGVKKREAYRSAAAVLKGMLRGSEASSDCC